MSKRRTLQRLLVRNSLEIFFATGIRFLFSFQMIPLHSNVQQVFNSVVLTFCSTKITQDYKLIDSFLPVWIYADVFLWHLSSKVSLFFILIITPILLHASLKMREKVRKRLSKEENNKRESRYRVTQGDRQSGRGKGMGGGCKGRRLRGRGCNRSFCRDTAAYKLRITGSNSRCGKFL